MSIINPLGERISYTYYPSGKLKTVSLPGGASETFEYDKNGNTTKVTDALGNTTYLEYDSLDRAIKLTNVLGHSKHFGYDAMGNITSMTDEKGRKTEYRYSPLGDIIEVIDPTGHSTKYSYDNMRRMTKFEQYRMIDTTYADVQKPEYQITTYERNKKGEVIATISPLGDVVKYKYDNAGQLISKRDEDEHETLYEYNLVGKLAKVSYADGKTVAFAYNPLKQLIAMHDWLGTTKIELDELGRARAITDFEGNEVGYAWNALGQREKTIYPDGSEVAYTYNQQGRIEKVIANTGETNYQYDTLGRIAMRILPEGTKSNYEFNPLGAITSLTHSTKDGDILDQFKYTYDPVGNITQIEKHRVGIESDNGVFQYTYDELNRLCAVVHNENDIRRYRYDELGNRVSQWQGRKYETYEQNPRTMHSYNARNQLIKTLEPKANTTTEYRYDKRGNMISQVTNGQLKATYAFDATNMMTGAMNTEKGTAEYTYNGFRNRIRKLENFHSDINATTIASVPCNEVRFILDMTKTYDNLISIKFSHSQDQNFVWGNSLLSSEGANATQNFHYLHDHIWSPVRFLGNNSADEATAFDEFGINTKKNEQQKEHFNNPFGFTGYQTDDIANLYFANARGYLPTIGIFNAQDTHWHPDNMLYGDCQKGLIPNHLAMLQSGNLYGYVVNNPLKFIDMLGENAWWVNDGLRYPGEVHTWVSQDIARNNLTLSRERWISLSECGRGRVDLVDRVTGEMFEIKPALWPREASIAQLQLYTTGTFDGPDISHLAPKIGNGARYNLNGDFERIRGDRIYIVQYRYEGRGIVSYSYVSRRKQPQNEPRPVPVPVPAFDRVVNCEDARRVSVDAGDVAVALGAAAIITWIIAIAAAPKTGGASIAIRAAIPVP